MKKLHNYIIVLLSILSISGCADFLDTVPEGGTITEEQILENLKSIRKGRTTIIIAHRLSAVKHADEIIVMDNGHIAEQGTYDELLKKKGIFHDIYVEQIAQAQ